MILRCDLKKQYYKLEDEILLAIKKVCESGCYILGSEVETFEKEFASYCGVKFGVGVASGTEALYLSLRALEIGEGDEVITSPFTPIPTVSAIVMAGAKPVFVDINKWDFLLDVNKLKEVITDRTKVIMPVHLFGNVLKMDELLNIAEKNNLFVVEDACQAHGSSYKEKKAGTMGHLGCFSFYPSKNLGGYGDAGMVVTNNENLYNKLRLLRDYGKVDQFTTSVPGINSRLDEIQAAVLRVKLRYLDEFNQKRRFLANIYFSRLKNSSLYFQLEDKESEPNYHIFVVRCEGERDRLREYLANKEVQTNIYYPVPMHLQLAYRYLGYKKSDFPFSEKACEEVIALPMYSELEPELVEKVADIIIDFFKKE